MDLIIWGVVVPGFHSQAPKLHFIIPFRGMKALNPKLDPKEPPLSGFLTMIPLYKSVKR